MEISHAFVFPSIRDAGAGAMVEAMMSGLAPVQGYLQTMERLATDPALCRRLGENARQRALDLFYWTARAREIDGCQTLDKPIKPMPLTLGA